MSLMGQSPGLDGCVPGIRACARLGAGYQGKRLWPSGCRPAGAVPLLELGTQQLCWLSLACGRRGPHPVGGAPGAFPFQSCSGLGSRGFRTQRGHVLFACFLTVKARRAPSSCSGGAENMKKQLRSAFWSLPRSLCARLRLCSASSVPACLPTQCPTRWVLRVGPGFLSTFGFSP